MDSNHQPAAYKTDARTIELLVHVPPLGFEPRMPLQAVDFKSTVSANSTTAAFKTKNLSTIDGPDLNLGVSSCTKVLCL